MLHRHPKTKAARHLFLPALALFLSSCGGGGGGFDGQPFAASAVSSSTSSGCDQSSCELADWDEIAHHVYLASAVSPHQQDFTTLGLAQPTVDRSRRAWLIDGGSHGQSISGFLDRIGLPSSRYTYAPIRLHEELGFSVAEIAAIYRRLTSADMVNFSFGFVYGADDDGRASRIKASEVRAGAWIVHSASNDGSQDLLAGLSEADREGTLAAAATGKIHFYYGLNDRMDGRDARSNGCRNVEQHCIGAPYEFVVQDRDMKVVSLAGTSYSAPFGFAAYLMAWERMPPETGIGEVFDLALSCVEDIGEPGADADTGRGRLDIGCMAHGARQAHGADAVAAASGDAYMDDFAQGLFGERLGGLTLPGATAAGVQVGIAGDSLAGTYRPALSASAYRPGIAETLQVALAPGFGLVGDGGDRLGAYLRLADRLRAELSLASGGDFFGGSGSGEFAFSCSRYASLALAGEVGDVDGSGMLRLSGWLQQGRAGCISGSLLDGLQGREAGLSAVYRRRVGDLEVSARAWAARFVGGDVQVAGQRFAISGSDASYGAGLRISHSF